MSQPLTPANSRAKRRDRGHPDKDRARKRRRTDTTERATNVPAAAAPSALAVWRAKFGRNKWVLFANGTAVKAPSLPNDDEVANWAIASLSGLERCSQVSVADNRSPNSREPGAAGTPRSGGWMVGPFDETSIYVYLEAKAAQTMPAAARLASRKVRWDRDHLQIVYIAAR